MSRCHWIATIGADWAAAACDDCHAGLHPLITVTVKFFSGRWPGIGEPVAVIRRRTRGDYSFPDLGQAMAGRLWWEHTPMLIDDGRGRCTEGIAGIGRRGAGQIAAGLAARRWPADAARLPWVASAYPGWHLAMDAAYREDRPGGCTAARLPGAASARLPASAAGENDVGCPRRRERRGHVLLTALT